MTGGPPESDGLAGKEPLQWVRCNLCGDEGGVVMHRPRQSPGPIVRCPRCGLIYVNPRSTRHMITGPVLGSGRAELLTSSSLEDAQQRWEWPLIAEQEQEAKAKLRNAGSVLARMRRLGYHNGQLLDVGCFSGIFLRAATSAGWQVCGLEPLPGPAIYARSVSGLAVTTDVVRDGLYPAGSFKVVTAFQVLEHMSDPLGSLRVMRDWLQEGGLVVIEVPSIDTFYAGMLGARNRHFVQDHFFFFSPRTLRELLSRAGFATVLITHPTRWLSLGYLVRWIGRYLSLPTPRVLHGNALARVLIPVNLGDIICAYARRD